MQRRCAQVTLFSVGTLPMQPRPASTSGHNAHLTLLAEGGMTMLLRFDRVTILRDQPIDPEGSAAVLEEVVRVMWPFALIAGVPFFPPLLGWAFGSLSDGVRRVTRGRAC